MNIAFTDTNLVSGSWTAGPIYLRNLLQAVRCADSSVGLFTLPLSGGEGADESARSIGADGVIWHEPPPRWRRDWALAWAARQFHRDTLPLEWTLRRAGIDAVFTFPDVYSFGNIPTLGWLPDFQHVHLPEMFSAEERDRRDQLARTALELTDRLVVMSEAIWQDLLAFAPDHVDKASVLKPVACVPESVYQRDPLAVARRYHLPERFVYVPNQFWMHKNHETLFRAVKLLFERGLDVHVVCSGSSFDHRHPEYFSKLAERVSLWNLRNNVAYVGLIDHADALGLIRQSVCVLNPSLFEGWGYAAEEARSVGKRTLLSDIPAHREQIPPKALFFDPYGSRDLAEKLEAVWREAEPGPDHELEADARATSDDRMRAYGLGFLRIATETMRTKRAA